MLARSNLAVAAMTALALGCQAAQPRVASGPQTEPRSASIPVSLNAPLEDSFRKWESDGPSGDAEHRKGLEKLASAIKERLAANAQADVVFVCTHNSRRSHMAQLLGLAAARRKGLGNVRTYSGGTEATAFNARAIAALNRVGFEIGAAEGKNPHYPVRLGPSLDPVEAFSKRFNDPPNPSSGFIVVMTCSQADAACPFVQGAVTRIAIPYEDPKIADGTPDETARYDERAAQIGRDLAWVFAAVSAR